MTFAAGAGGVSSIERSVPVAMPAAAHRAAETIKIRLPIIPPIVARAKKCKPAARAGLSLSVVECRSEQIFYAATTLRSGRLLAGATCLSVHVARAPELHHLLTLLELLGLVVGQLGGVADQMVQAVFQHLALDPLLVAAPGAKRGTAPVGGGVQLELEPRIQPAPNFDPACCRHGQGTQGWS